MFRSKIIVFYICCVLGASILNMTLTFGEENKSIYISVDDLIQDLEGKWENAFSYVRDSIQFEPSPHFLKSSNGVLWGSRGNAMEKSALLLDILANMGETARLVSGRLDRKTAESLIGTLFSEDEKGNFTYAQDVPLSQPLENETLIANVVDHYWIQIYKDGQWLDLDTAFPDAVSGKTFAEMEKFYSKIPDDFFPMMTISLSIEKEKGREDILMIQEDLQVIVNQPVTLSISTIFQESEEEKQSGGGALGGAFGGLSGGTSGQKKVKGLEAIYKAELKVGEDRVVSGEYKEEIPESSKKTPAHNPINRVWLHFRLIEKGEVLLESERILFEKIQDTDEHPLFQRHSILIAPNKIPLTSWEEKLERVTNERVLDEVRSGVEEIKANIKNKNDQKSLLDKSLALEEKIGPELGHLINMIFAYVSDSNTENTGEALSVYTYFTLPRIFIHSVEGDGRNILTSMDLRQDSISAVPYPDQALAMKETFLYGRGVFESVLEGKILELFSGKKALTTAMIMQEATRRYVPIRLYSELEKNELAKLNMPDHVRRIALESIVSGSVLIMPDRSVRFEGEDRWGWWKVEPRTREVVGVLDSGLHQAMFQRTVLDTEGMLNSKMGFAIGAITGAVDTQWMLAGMALKYGELNKEALQEIKDYMQEIKAYMCPEFEKSASVTIASVTVIDIEDCYKKEFSWGYEGGVKVEMGWCQAFAKGFACASSSILNHYLSQYE